MQYKPRAQAWQRKVKSMQALGGWLTFLKNQLSFFVGIFLLLACNPSYVLEQEPNNDVKTAQLVKSHTLIKGTYYSSWGRDRDCYRYELNEPKMFRAKVSGVKGVDVRMYVYFLDENRPKKIIDDNLSSLGESLGPIYVDAQNVVLCLEPHNALNQEEYQKLFYEFTASLFSPLAGVEREPNDYPEEANEISQESIVGYYNHGILIRQEGREILERDYYVMELFEDKRYLVNFELTPVAGIDPVVKIFNSQQEQIRLVDEKGISQGEYLWHFGVTGPGKLYFSISAKDRKMNFADYYEFKVKLEEYAEQVEFEPNDSMEKATHLTREEFSGTLTDKGDVDFFWLVNPNSYALEYQVVLENKSQLNLILESFTKEGRKLNTYNDSPAGLNEAISSLILSEGEGVFLKVSAVNPSVELFPAHYVFRIRSQIPLDFSEREPNNRMQEANPLAIGSTIIGYINPNSDQDVFFVNSKKRFQAKVIVEGIPGCRMLLRVGDKTGAIYESRESRREGEGLSVTFSCEAQSYLFLYCNRASQNLYSLPYKLSIGEF